MLRLLSVVRGERADLVGPREEEMMRTRMTPVS